MTDTAINQETTDFEITCPSCDADLGTDANFLTYRVCSNCDRHFSMPAVERANAIVDAGTFRPLLSAPQTGIDEDVQASSLDRLASARERQVVQDAIVTGTGELGGTPVTIIALDDQLVGNQIGALGAEKIIVALEQAQAHRTPVITIIAGGSSGVRSGPLAVVQSARISSVASQVQALGIPMIGVLTHPTSAAVFNSVASPCDLLFAEPGTSVGVVWSADRPLDAQVQAIGESALMENGWIDGVLPRPDQHDRLASIIGLVSRHSVDIAPKDVKLPTELDRPLVEYLDVVMAPFTEMRGDRVEFDDRGVVTGIGAIGDVPVAVAVQDSRVDTNTTAALRKIQRIARFAGRFELPLVMVVDGKEPEQPLSVNPGESFATAKLSSMLSVLPIPVISVGAGCIQGLVSNMMMYGDRTMMAETAKYRLNRSISRIPGMPAEGPEWSARECLKMGLIDQVIEMPEGGVSADPWMAVRMLREDVRSAVIELSRLGPRRLIERRAHARRELGNTEEGIASVLGELREWQDVQQSVKDSIEDWREKLEQRVGNSDWRERLQQSSPRPGFQRPDMGELAARLKSRQERLKQELLERAGRAERNDSEGKPG